jgi:hypothetical protein
MKYRSTAACPKSADAPKHYRLRRIRSIDADAPPIFNFEARPRSVTDVTFYRFLAAAGPVK